MSFPATRRMQKLYGVSHQSQILTVLWGTKNAFLGPSIPSKEQNPSRTNPAPSPSHGIIPAAPAALPSGPAPLPSHTIPFLFLFLLKSKPGDSIATRSSRGLTPALCSALSLRFRLPPGRCEELQLSIPLAPCVGGQALLWRREASAVTNRSDTGCLWHQGRAGRGFSFAVPLPLHSLFGRYCGSPPGSGAPGRKLERSQASFRRGWGSAAMPPPPPLPLLRIPLLPQPLLLCLAQPQGNFSQGNHIPGVLRCPARPLPRRGGWCFCALWVSSPEFGRAPLNLGAEP